MTIHDFTYTGGDSGAPYQAQQYDRLDRAVTQVQYYVDSVRDWRQDVVNYATQARQDRDHIQTLGDTIVNTGEHIDTMVQVSVDAAETATTAASHTATDRQAAQVARTGAETAETNAQGYATDAASSASSAADILVATEALGITVDNSVGERVFVGDTMIHGDTGWRVINDAVTVPTIEGKLTRILIKRENSLVTLSAGHLYIEGSHTSGPFMEIPHGFRATKTFRYSGAYEAGSSAKIYTSAVGEFLNATSTLSGRSRFYVQYITDNAWPTSLPGVPG